MDHIHLHTFTFNTLHAYLPAALGFRLTRLLKGPAAPAARAHRRKHSHGVAWCLPRGGSAVTDATGS